MSDTQSYKGNVSEQIAVSLAIRIDNYNVFFTVDTNLFYEIFGMTVELS